MDNPYPHQQISVETPPKTPQEARHGVFSENSGQHSAMPCAAADSDDSGYGAGSIRILDVAAQRERFSFAAAVALAEDYPHVPASVIHRLLTAAMISGTPREDVVGRYLEGSKGVVITPEFTAAYRELMNEARRG